MRYPIALLYQYDRDRYELYQPDLPESVQRQLESLLAPYVNSGCSVEGTAQDIGYEIEGWAI